MNQPERRQPRPADQKEAFDAGDPESVEKRKRKAAEVERRRIAGLKMIVENENARTWLWDLLSSCGIFRSSFTGNSETFFREGARNVGLKIQAELAKNFPDALVTMMREAE